jgi:hypothetical protein
MMNGVWLEVSGLGFKISFKQEAQDTACQGILHSSSNDTVAAERIQELFHTIMEPRNGVSSPPVVGNELFCSMPTTIFEV